MALAALRGKACLNRPHLPPFLFTGALALAVCWIGRFRPLNGASPGLNIVFDDILNHIFVVHEDGRTVDVLSQAKPEPRQWILPEHGEPVRSLRFSLDGNVLAYYYEPRTLVRRLRLTRAM